MAYPGTTSSAFLTTVGRWIEQDGEVFVLIRHHAAAGLKDYETRAHTRLVQCL